MAKVIDEEPYGYAFRVYSRPVNMERDYVALDGSPTNQPHVEGDTVEYSTPYGFKGATPITLGEDVVRENARGKIRNDFLYGRPLTNDLKRNIEDVAVRRAGYNGMLQDTISLPHKGVSLIGLSDPAYSLYSFTRFDTASPIDDTSHSNKFLQLRQMPRQLFENMKKDKRYAVRLADMDDFDDDDLNKYRSDRDAAIANINEFRKHKRFLTEDDMVTAYVMDLDRLSAMPKAYFNSKYMPFYNTVLDTGDVESDASNIMAALARGDIEHVRRMLASGSYGEDIANSNMYKRAKATREWLTPNMYGDPVGDSLRQMLLANVLGHPAERAISMSGIGSDIANDTVAFISEDTGHKYGVPGNRPWRTPLLEENALPHIGAPALNAMHTMSHMPEQHKDLEYYYLLKLLHNTLKNASSWEPGMEYNEAILGAPILVKVPLSSIYTRDDVERGDMRAQRDSRAEIVAKQFTPLREIPAEDIYNMMRHYEADLYNFERFNAPIKYTPEWYAKLRKLDTKYGNKLLKIAGIKKGKKDRPIISDEEKKFILDDMRSELNKPQYADLKEHCTTSRLNNNVCQALTSGGTQWR